MKYIKNISPFYLVTQENSWYRKNISYPLFTSFASFKVLLFLSIIVSRVEMCFSHFIDFHWWWNCVVIIWSFWCDLSRFWCPLCFLMSQVEHPLPPHLKSGIASESPGFLYRKWYLDSTVWAVGVFATGLIIVVRHF